MGPTPWPPPRPASRSDHRSHCVKHAVLQHPFGSTMPTSYPEVVWCPFGEHAWGQGSASAPLASGSVRVMRNHTINQPGMMNPPARDLTPVAKSSFYSANSDKFHPLGTYPVLGPMLRAHLCSGLCRSSQQSCGAGPPAHLPEKETESFLTHVRLLSESVLEFGAGQLHLFPKPAFSLQPCLPCFKLYPVKGIFTFRRRNSSPCGGSLVVRNGF